MNKILISRTKVIINKNFKKTIDIPDFRVE